MTSATEIIAYLLEHDFQVSLDERSGRVRIQPMPSEQLIERLRPRRDDLAAFLREHQTPTKHRYIVWSGTLDRARSVCLSCGHPPVFHGLDPLADPLVVDDPNDAPLIAASAVAASAAAVALTVREEAQ